MNLPLCAQRVTRTDFVLFDARGVNDQPVLLDPKRPFVPGVSQGRGVSGDVMVNDSVMVDLAQPVDLDGGGNFRR